MKRSASLLAIGLVTAAVTARAQGPVQTDAPRPIDAGSSLWAEELTWMEIRDLVKAGTTTVELGRKLAGYRAGITAKAFKASQQRLR